MKMKVTDEGTDSLFQQYPIKGIQEIERKLRNDIEKKKEDLRQMVGERYQDLMNAADTITDMKSSAESVTSHIKAMEERCCSIYNQATPSGILQKSTSKAQLKSKPLESKFALGVQLKIIMDLPTLFWSSVDDHHFSNAAEMYLLSQYVASSLSYDPTSQLGEGQTLAHAFPIVATQVLQIGKYRYAILQNCRDYLKKEDLNHLDMIDILCSLLLLDDSSLLEILQEFLDMRTAALDHVLKLDKDDSTISGQVSDVVSIICNTILLVAKVFHSEEKEKSLLLKIYYDFASENRPGPISHFTSDDSPSFSYLPENVKSFRCALNSKLKPVTSQQLQNSCQKWLSNVIALVQLKVKSLLQYVVSIKGVAAIWEKINDTYKQVCGSEEEWSHLCLNVLNKPFSPYDDLLKSVITERIETLLCDGLESSFSNCQSNLQHLLNNILSDDRSLDSERDLTGYIWSESINDLAIQPGWLTRNSSATNLQTHAGTLAMKASGYTPQVQNLCNELDERFGLLLEDLKSFGDVRGESPETDELRIYAQNIAKQEMNNLLKCIDGIVNNQANSEFLSIWNPTIGRLTRAISELCPNLKQCFSKENNDSEWLEMKKKILKTSERSLRDWLLNVVQKELASLANQSLSECQPSNMLQSILAWEETQISEETEDGATVKSNIRLPLQPSGFLQSSLTSICQQINRTVGHSLPRLIIRECGLQFLSGAMSIYENASQRLKTPQLNPRFVQNFALQLLFDVQFLFMAFASNKSTHQSSPDHSSVVNSLESLIDPFDLDVFNPALQINLNIALHKSNLLMGLFLSERVLISSVGSFQGTPQPSNLLLCSGGVARFQLLPASTKAEKSHHLDTKMNSSPKMVRGFGSSPSLSSAASGDADSVSKSSSFYDRFSAMGASWFGSTQ